MEALSSADISLFEGFRLDRRGGVLSRRGEQGFFAPIAIGGRALDILGVLIDRPGDLVSRAEIIDAVWPGTVVEDSNLNVQIATLRRILDDGRAEGSCIQTVAGRGYRFVPVVTRSDAGPSQSGLRPPRLSIVVLPFTNLSDDREQQYFADGITEDLTTDLSRIEGSFVISRNTAFTYKDKPVSAKQIGRDLGVRYVLEGSVRRAGNQARITVQLIEAETDAHLWAERFDSDAVDLFALQNEITARIGNTLGLELIGAEAARPTADPDALDYLLRGRAARAKGPSGITEAIGLFERVLALDPGSVAAGSQLAMALMDRVLDQLTDSVAADIARAEGLIDRVLTVSPRNLLAHFAKGQVLRAQRRCEEASLEYEMVLELNHNAAGALMGVGRCRVLTGSLDEAIPPMEQAIRLDPRGAFIATWYASIGEAHLLQSRVAEAILWLGKSRSVSPRLPSVHARLASAYALNGDLDRAAAELAEARSLSRDDRYSSVSCLKAAQNFGVPKVRALFENTYLAGLRKAGMPEE
jgi:TolB-like protein/tetratricopeptide (TPR) repeat protein